jgi:hypothetical protein
VAEAVDKLLELVGGHGELVEETNVVGGTGSADEAAMRLEEKVKRIRVSDSAVNNETCREVSSAPIGVLVRFGKEASGVALGTNTNKDTRAVGRGDASACLGDSVVFVLRNSGVLTLRDTVAEQKNTLGILALVVLGKAVQVLLNHVGEVDDNVTTTFLETDLRRVGVALAVVRGNRAGHGGVKALLAWADRWLQSGNVVDFFTHVAKAGAENHGAAWDNARKLVRRN